MISRVKRLLERASREARPQLASPSHFLLALVTGNEPACEILTTLGVDLTGLAAATRREIDERGTAGERASSRTNQVAISLAAAIDRPTELVASSPLSAWATVSGTTQARAE